MGEILVDKIFFGTYTAKKIHDLPAQQWMLQSVCSTALPVHAAPPHMALFLVLVFCFVPPPQDLVQLLHDCQLFQEQSTEMDILM